MTKGKTYAELKEELEAILMQLESNTDDIDKAIEQYKKGQEILAEIEKYLEKTKAKIDTLKPKQ
ncbi:MAG TPA: exodeoxyribonuclease VII small subunit [Patescibacteria group bacterium]|nr:exodeoxyribonuclease VII small subunit [Patescibacteria group bacterium]